MAKTGDKGGSHHTPIEGKGEGRHEKDKKQSFSKLERKRHEGVHP
jgi:hypothetical protein